MIVCVDIGGGIAHKFSNFAKPLEKELVRLLPMYSIPKISKSQLEEAGLSGGLAYYAAKIRAKSQN